MTTEFVKPRVMRIRVPLLGKLAFARDEGDAIHTSGQMFETNWTAEHIRAGEVIDQRELGSGLVTNAGVNELARDWFWTAGATTFELQKNLASGTGSTAAAVGDFALGTAIGTTATAGVQTTVEPNVYQTVGTIAYTGTSAVTECGVFMSSTISGAAQSTGTSTAVGTTSMTLGSATWTVDQWKGYTVTTGAVMALILSNSATVLTIGSWRTPATNALASNPSTGAFVINPTMWDRKVFSAINVVNLDSVAFTYQLTDTSGG